MLSLFMTRQESEFKMLCDKHEIDILTIEDLKKLTSKDFLFLSHD